MSNILAQQNDAFNQKIPNLPNLPKMYQKNPRNLDQKVNQRQNIVCLEHQIYASPDNFTPALLPMLETFRGSAVYGVQCTVHSVQYTVYNLQCTVHSVQWALLCKGFLKGTNHDLFDPQAFPHSQFLCSALHCT